MSEKRNIGFGNEEDEERKPRKPFGVGFDEKNYLDVKLKSTETEKVKKIRLLPFDGESNTPFKIIKMHNIRVPKEISESTWKSYVCLQQDDVDHEKYGDKCPFCELNHLYYEKMDAAKKANNEEEVKRWRELSLSYKTQEVCICRCIERGAEAEGPKFWKFNVRSDNEDPMHKIKALQKLRKQESIDTAKEENNGELPEDFEADNILDLYNGKDLQLTIKPVFDKEGKRTNKTTIGIADYGKFKPITPDDDVLDAWIDDEKKWYDVFTIKPYEYLELIGEGEIPFFDKINGKWISKIKKKEGDDAKKEDRITKNEKANAEIKAAEEKAAAVKKEEDKAEDLPF